MIKRKFIYDIHRRYNSTLYNHEKNSADILSRITTILDKYPIPYRLDYMNPYHLIVNCNRLISIFANGFNNRIDVQPLKDNGEASKDKERGFMTPQGTVNYILKMWGTNQHD